MKINVNGSLLVNDDPVLVGMTMGAVQAGPTASASVSVNQGVGTLNLTLPQGETGPSGPTGANGAEGPQGPTGADGIEGPQGPTGATGADGPQGPTGVEGPTGPTGATGAEGPQGPTGANGAEGPQGPTGATGSTGPQGPTGADGTTGPTGATGVRGTKWYSGTAITGTSTTAAVFSGSGITDALAGDMYLNTSTGYYYTCVVGGNAATATWKYNGSLPANDPYVISNTKPSRACIWFDTSVS